MAAGMASTMAPKAMLAVQKALTKAQKTVLKMAAETESKLESTMAHCLVSN
jgi:hypothetical protein